MANNNNLPTKRKQTLNPKLTSEDNVHHEAVKRHQELQSQTKTSGTASHSSRQASVKAVDDPEDCVYRNAGRPKNPKSILEATDDEEDEEDEATQQAAKRQKEKHVHTKTFLLSHVCNRLMVDSTLALLCLGTWSKLGYVNKEDLLAAAMLPEVKEGEEDLPDDFDLIL